MAVLSKDYISQPPVQLGMGMQLSSGQCDILQHQGHVLVLFQPSTSLLWNADTMTAAGQPSGLMRWKSCVESGRANWEQSRSLMIVGLLYQPKMLTSLHLLEGEINLLKSLTWGLSVTCRGMSSQLVDT